MGKSSAQVDVNSSLVLRPLTKEQHGHWECRASSQVASVSTTTLVHVLGESLVPGRQRPWLGTGRDGNVPPQLSELSAPPDWSSLCFHPPSPQVPVPTLSPTSLCSHSCWQSTSPGSQDLMGATSRGSASGTPPCTSHTPHTPPPGTLSSGLMGPTSPPQGEAPSPGSSRLGVALGASGGSASLGGESAARLELPVQCPGPEQAGQWPLQPDCHLRAQG